uniref:Uncharacterized protein n=1 Tax=Klebsiella phage FKP3 TaxID=3231233 RepID=A0AAU8HZT2_9CAUD
MIYLIGWTLQTIQPTNKTPFQRGAQSALSFCLSFNDSFYRLKSLAAEK